VIDNNNDSPKSYCGYVAIIGRPNVGKSTLLNHLIGQKISITSRKPQTTRTRILGIKTEGPYQILYVDTPGLHQKTPHALNRHMNRAVLSVLEEVDIVLFLVDGLIWNEGDEWVLEAIKRAQKTAFLVVNKIDTVKSKENLLPHIKKLSEAYPFKNVLLVSAKTSSGLANLEEAIHAYLPANGHFFQGEELTDVSERFIVAEFIREKIIRSLGEELPYATAVTIEKFKYENGILHLNAYIWVEREGQKGIVIGKNGEKLKQIGSSARKDIEQFLDCKVFLALWVKVKSGWGDDERLLKTLGI
jgi:GTP-binding protein Era